MIGLNSPSYHLIPDKHQRDPVHSGIDSGTGLRQIRIKLRGLVFINFLLFLSMFHSSLVTLLCGFIAGIFFQYVFIYKYQINNENHQSLSRKLTLKGIEASNHLRPIVSTSIYDGNTIKRKLTYPIHHHKHHPHHYISKRHHPDIDKLSICYENPVLKSINISKLQELESNEWKAYDDHILSRTTIFAEFYGSGLFNGATPSSLCGQEITGSEEAMDFFEYSLDALLPCPLKLYGEVPGDTGKELCAVESMNQDGCIIYSLGSNNQFDFEESILKSLDKCEVFTFDCTSNPPANPIARLTFDKLCLGNMEHGPYHTYEYITSKYNHSRIDLLKMDIEGYEVDVFNALITPPYSKLLPYQLSFETHFWTYSVNWALIHMAVFIQLKKAGYRPVSRKLNPACISCTEHTFIRAFC
jgi:hypothetical protein